MSDNVLSNPATRSGVPATDERSLAEVQAVDRRRWLPHPGGPARIARSVVLAFVVSAFLVLPLIGVVQRAAVAGTLFEAIRRPIVYEAVRLSLLTSSTVLVLGLVFGMPLALVHARRTFRGIPLLDTLVDLPIVLPPAVACLALLLTFGRRGLLGPALDAIGVQLPFTTAAVVIASFFVATHPLNAGILSSSDGPIPAEDLCCLRAPTRDAG